MANLDVTINSNAQALAAVIGGVAKRELPFATATAINDLAFGAMRVARQELDDVMELRNRFSQSGVQVNKADKGAWPDITAEVGIESRRDYLIDHITGGTRTGQSRHGRAILKDTSLRNARGRVPQSKRPGRLIRRKKRKGQPPTPFMIKSSKGNELLVRRSGKDRYPLEILYAFRHAVKIKREFEMDVVTQDYVDANYDKAFAKALQRAMRTAKPKAERAASMSRGRVIGRGR